MLTLCAFDLYLALRLKTIGCVFGEGIGWVFENLDDQTEWMKRSAYVVQDCGILCTKFINYYVWVCVEPLTMPNDRPYCWIETILLSGTQWCLCTRRTHRYHPPARTSLELFVSFMIFMHFSLSLPFWRWMCCMCECGNLLEWLPTCVCERVCEYSSMREIKFKF